MFTNKNWRNQSEWELITKKLNINLWIIIFAIVPVPVVVYGHSLVYILTSLDVVLVGDNTALDLLKLMYSDPKNIWISVGIYLFWLLAIGLVWASNDSNDNPNDNGKVLLDNEDLYNLYSGWVIELWETKIALKDVWYDEIESVINKAKQNSIWGTNENFNKVFKKQ